MMSACRSDVVVAGNSHRTFYGNVMTVFNVVDLKKGDEVTVNYCDPLDPYQKRADRLKFSYDFSCDCRLCELDRADRQYEWREHLVQCGLQLSQVAASCPDYVVIKLRELLLKCAFGLLENCLNGSDESGRTALVHFLHGFFKNFFR